MKKILFFLLILSGFSICGQTIEFDTIGRIIKLNAAASPTALSVNPGTAVNTATLNSICNDIKLSISSISVACVATKGKIEEKEYSEFLKRYLGTNYDDLLKFYSDPANLSVIKKLNAFKAPVYYWETNALLKRLVYNEALIGTYNDLYKPENIKDLDTKKLKSLSDFVVNTRDQLETYKKKLKALNDDFDPKMLSDLYNYLNKNINPTNTTGELGEIKKYLSSNWVKEWLWLRKGSAVLNPFDFTSKDFVQKNPEYDETKSKLYNTFMDSAVAKYIKNASMTNLEDFKKAIAEQGRGKDVYSFKVKNDQLVQANQKSMDALRQSTLTLNQFSPDLLAYSNKYFISTIKETQITGNNTSYYTVPLRIGIDSVKRIIVINVPTGRKTFLKEKEEIVKDKSSFQLIADSVVSSIGQIASLVSKFTSFGTLFDPVQKVNAINILKVTPNKVNIENYQMEEFPLPKAKPTPLEILNKYYGLIDQDPVNITDEVKIKNVMKEIRETLKESLNQRLYDYEELANTFCNTIAPPTTLTLTANKTSAYKNEVLTTKDPEKTAINTIQIKSFIPADKSDTTVIAEFKYRSGKTSRAVLGAGLVVNPWPNRFIQTEVVEESGKITIKNNNQMFNFVGGVHLHLGKGLFVLDDQFKSQTEYLGRVSLFAGVGITKKPLDNIFAGVGYDVFPGLKIMLYAKWYRNDIVTIRNNEVTYREIHYMAAPAIGINIDATSLISTLTNVTKLK